MIPKHITEESYWDEVYRLALNTLHKVGELGDFESLHSAAIDFVDDHVFANDERLMFDVLKWSVNRDAYFVLWDADEAFPQVNREDGKLDHARAFYAMLADVVASATAEYQPEPRLSLVK